MTCRICGAHDYTMSYGGSDICPPCDAGIEPVQRLRIELDAANLKCGALRIENTSLREQLRVAQERWISVEERLPDKYPCLMWDEYNDPEVVRNEFALINGSATHWMPLPTPPAESTEGKKET